MVAKVFIGWMNFFPLRRQTKLFNIYIFMNINFSQICVRFQQGVTLSLDDGYMLVK